ncbi:MAG: putative capsular polysaccharide synthesis family protein [Desulfobacter sp.]
MLNTLENRGMDVLHEHCLTNTHYDAVGIKREFGVYSGIRSKLVELRRKIYPSQRLRTFHKTKRVKIITIVREPISRNLSLCFQHFTDFVRDDVTNRCFDDQKSSVEMFSHYLENKIDQKAGIYWFDREFLPTTGVDIYDFPFDREKGCTALQSGKYDILVLQLEKLNASMSSIQEFLGLTEPVELVQKNIGRKKWYHLLYQEFKSAYAPPQSLVDEIYTSRFMKHFYSDADISRFRRKWEKTHA